MSKDFDRLLANKINSSFADLEVEFNESDWNAFLAKEKNLFSFSEFANQHILKIAAIFFLLIASVFVFRNSIFQEGQSLKDTNNQIAENQQPEVIAPENNKEGSEPTILLEEKPLDDLGQNKKATQDHTKEEIIIPSSEEESLKSVSVTSITYVYIDQKYLSRLSLKNNFLSSNFGEFLVNEPKLIYAGRDGGEEPNKKSSKPELELHVSSLTNYSEVENSSSLSYSGGIGSEIRLMDKIALSGGFTIAKQGVAIEDNGVEVTTESQLSETGIRTSANLITLDIPLNMRFYLPEKRTYFSVGLSSFLYLKEEFNTTFTQVTELTIEENGQQTVIRDVEEINNSITEKAFSRFDFARVLNLSLGFRRDLSNKTGLIVQPYLKIPLSPLTSEEEEFGSAGLNIRINFKNQ